MDRAQTLQAIQGSIPAIARNGALVCRNEPGRRPGYSLRFRITCPKTGARKQRRLDLGDDAELIELVRQAVACRKRRRAENHEAEVARAEESKRRRAMERELMNQTEGSRRYRQGVRKAFREFCAAVPKPDLDEASAYVSGLALKRRGPGRPLKSRLW